MTTTPTPTASSARAIDATVGAIFVPVRDIESARDWYVQLLDYPTPPDIVFGHLAVFPLDPGSSSLVLDSRIHRESEHRSTPLFHFNAGDLAAARTHLNAMGVTEIGEVQHDQWFTFTDPDGNVLMVRQND